VPPTARQSLGRKGEEAVRENVPCPRCSRRRHLTLLPTNFQCADLICKFCGFLAHVKSVTLIDGRLPDRVMGAAWGPQREQIIAGIFQPLFLAGFSPDGTLLTIDYIPAHILQSSPAVFEPRKPLSDAARRAGWQGFFYDLTQVPAVGMVRVFPAPSPGSATE
jgi:hypothetical protein